MADIQDTDLFLVNRNNSTSTLPASQPFLTIFSTTILMLVNRGGNKLKVVRKSKTAWTKDGNRHQ